MIGGLSAGRTKLKELLELLIGVVVLTSVFVSTELAQAKEQTSVTLVGDFSGEWDTTYGLLTILQSENRAEGHYTYAGGSSISGAINGNRFDFSYVEPSATGEGWFLLSEDGSAFSGQWRADGTYVWGGWSGSRRGSVAAVTGEPFTGLYDTTYGRMRLRQEGNRVVGVYSFQGGSSVQGEVSEARLVFRYQEPTASGQGWFELADDGNQLNGSWQADGSSDWTNWTGQRVEPEPGLVWLVVLEAPWELSLAENEYAFGYMLRTYFERYPHVRVRHRRYYDEPSFLATMNELIFLAEPVALLIAGHGESGSLTVNRDRISANVIGQALAQAPNVYVVHFSACEMMVGETADTIQSSLSAGHRLAVSGYATAVDWSASALVEFFYLDLVLGRSMEPDQAARVVLQDLAFSGDAGGSPLGAARFRFSMP